MMLFFVSSFMINVVGPFYFQGVMGLRPTQVGLLFLVVPLVNALTGAVLDLNAFSATVATLNGTLCAVARSKPPVL